MASSTSSAGSSSATTPKRYTCDAEGCGKTYSKPSLLEQHRRSHTGERPFPCPEPGCGKSFLRKSHLQAHAVSHQELTSKPFHCSVCGKGVNSPQHLKRHEIIHTKSFTCPAPGCEESFYKHQSMRHHFHSVHDKSLTCTTCGKTFTRPYRLAQHNIKFHGDSPVYQCDHLGCYRNFKTWSALQLHIKTEHPKLKCPECGKGCVGKTGLRAHMAGCHDSTAVKLWNCEYCLVGQFAKKAELLEHYRDFHDGNIPDDLMKQAEKDQLEQLLSHPQSCGLENLGSLDYAPIATDSTRSIDSFNLEMESGTSVTDLLVNNVDLKTIPCPKKKCTRMFRRDYDLQRHLKWHEARLAKIESFLASLDAENAHAEQLVDTLNPLVPLPVAMNPSDTHKTDDESLVHGSNSDFEDQELDELIDLELQLLAANNEC